MLATLLGNAEQLCKQNARLLVGLAFASAFLWKGFLSHDYLDGTFFHAQFFFDGRFGDFAKVAGGMTSELLRHNRFILRQLTVGGISEVAFLQTTPRLWLLAEVLTWWTLVIEGTIAVMFLVPTQWALAKVRDWVLIIFIGTTYAVAPVAGFGWLLIIMGLAQSDQNNTRLRLSYLASFVLILAYSTVSLTAAMSESMGPESSSTEASVSAR